MYHNNFIHPTAILDNVELGICNYIGPYCVLQNCVIGDNNRLEGFCSVGLPPQHRKFPLGGLRVRIGSSNVIREFVTVHAGTQQATLINDDNVFYAKAHIGHDVWVGSHVTVSNDVDVAGHCRLYDYANLGMGVKVHQFSVIPPGAMIGMGVTVNKGAEIHPFCKYAGIGRSMELPNTKYFIEQGILTETEINQLTNEYTKNSLLNAHA